MTKITEYIRNANGKTLFSIEIIPPLKGESIRSLMDSIEPLMDFKPPFVDVTYHREEYIEKIVDGQIARIPIRKRPGTVGICASLMQRFGVEAVPHVICGGFTKEETEDFLFDLHYLGVENVLVLRGDPVKGHSHFTPEKGGHAYATDLIKQVVDMNRGKLLHEETQAAPTNFCVGVSGYPEKHFEAPNRNADFKYLKQKIDLGAEYIVTQMFFDNQRYFDFVAKCREHGITAPIIPGLKPLSTKKQLTALPRVFHLDIPDELETEVQKCQTDREVRQVGIEWGIRQCRELMAAGAPVLHFYTMGKSDNVRKIAEAVF